MMNTYALHETLELHEITVFKTACLTKTKMMQNLVTDPILQNILDFDAQITARQVKELKDLLSNTVE
jgi:similar to spore coat protein